MKVYLGLPFFPLQLEAVDSLLLPFTTRYYVRKPSVLGLSYPGYVPALLLHKESFSSLE